MAQESQTDLQFASRSAPETGAGTASLNSLDLGWPGISSVRGGAVSYLEQPPQTTLWQKGGSPDRAVVADFEQTPPSGRAVAHPTEKDAALPADNDATHPTEKDSAHPADNDASHLTNKDAAHPAGSDQAPQQAAGKDQPQTPAVNATDNARDHLNNLVDSLVASKALKGKDRDRFKADMATFETRATQAGLDPAEVTKTYENLSQLVEFNGQAPIDQSSRIKIAEQAMHHAAIPTQIDQGRHDTCNVTTVEVRTFTRAPAEAVKMISDVATTGSFTTTDGSKITIDAKSLRPDDEASGTLPSDGQRSYASQIFQITAANIHWQRSDTDPAGNYATVGSLRYEQDPSKRSYFSGDTGERLKAYYTIPPKELAKGPAMGASDLQDIYDQTVGGNEKGFVIENKIHGGPNTVQVASEKDLRTALSDMKKNGHLPAIIRVHTGNEPFLTDQGGGLSRSKGVWHVVSVTAYDEQTGKVWIDNQWGRSSDHQMKVSDLYDATLEPKGGAWQMIHESTMPTIHWPRHKHEPDLLPENKMWIH